MDIRYNAMLQLLSDTYYLHQKTLYIHWNVDGHHFFSLHKALEEQYDELHSAIDEIAERIKSIDSGYDVHVHQTPSFEHKTQKADAHSMISDLIKSHQAVIETIKHVISSCSNDAVTEDMAIERLAQHEKTLWMLKSFNEQTC
ncbi:MAG: Dps family protein [Candidatus Comchoanobacterales bacterium]